MTLAEFDKLTEKIENLKLIKDHLHSAHIHIVTANNYLGYDLVEELDKLNETNCRYITTIVWGGFLAMEDKIQELFEESQKEQREVRLENCTDNIKP